MAKAVPVLEAAGLVLRPLRESDKAIRLGIPRDPEYVRLNGGEPSEAGPLGKEGVERWFESRADSLRWVIALDDRPIGEIRFHKFAPDCRSARLAIGIWEPSNWNKGLGTQAVELALEYGFEQLELRAVELYVLEINMRALHVYAKCGFSKVETLPDRVFADGRWLADVVMSITADQWSARVSRP